MMDLTTTGHTQLAGDASYVNKELLPDAQNLPSTEAANQVTAYNRISREVFSIPVYLIGGYASVFPD